MNVIKLVIRAAIESFPINQEKKERLLKRLIPERGIKQEGNE